MDKNKRKTILKMREKRKFKLADEDFKDGKKKRMDC